jgi:hypothetical protein
MEAAKLLLSEHKRQKHRESLFSVKTLGEVAAFFGLAEATVKQWTTRQPPLPGKHGDWPLRDIVRWREAWLTAADLKTKQQQQNFELGHVKLESDRLELQQKQRLLLHVDDVELWASTAIVEFRETVMQLKEILTSAAPPEVKDFVRAETDRHLRDALTAASRRLDVKQIEVSE